MIRICIHIKKLMIITKIRNKGKSEKSGFVAMISLILLAFSTMTISLVVFGASVVYIDSVNRKEMRIQTALNLEACKMRALDILARDYYVSGRVEQREFGCELEFIRSTEQVIIYATTTMKYIGSNITRHAEIVVGI